MRPAPGCACSRTHACSWPEAEARREVGSQAAVAPLIAHLDDADAKMRKAVVDGLAQGLEAIDRRLLSRDLSRHGLFLDPRKPIGEAFVQKAAVKLKLTPEEVRARYEAMAGQFHLRLEWRAGDKKS